MKNKGPWSAHTATAREDNVNTVTDSSDGGNSPPRPLTTAAVAAELGVSARTIRRLILAGDIPAYTIGTGTTCRHYRVTPHALASYRQRHQTGKRVAR